MISAGSAGLTLAQVGKVGVQVDEIAGAKMVSGCNSDRDCSSAEKCLRHRCIEEDMECLDENECARERFATEACAEHLRKYWAQKSACSTDRDCLSSEKCLRGSCIEEEQGCIDSGDCQTGEICDNTKQCRTTAELLSGKAACSADRDCQTGERCLRRACIEDNFQCIDSRDCQTGEICDNTKQCRTTAELLSGKAACSADRDCQTGERCLRRACIEDNFQCIDSRDCQTGEICDNTKQCRTTAELLSGKAACSADRDCQTGERCLRRACIEDNFQCIDSRDCQTGEICDNTKQCRTTAELLGS